MTRIFLRFYVALLGVIALSAGLLWGSQRWSVDPGLPSRLEAVAAAPTLVSGAFVAATDPDRRELAARELSERLGVPVEIEPLARAQDVLVGLPGDRLRRGEPVWAPWGAGDALLVRVPDQPFVVVLRPPGLGPTRQGPPVYAALALLAAGAAIFVSLRPVQRQLEALSEASRRFGAGDLGSRAPVVTEDAAGELARNFNAMAERVATLVRGREQLLAGVSHELRTPIARLRFAAELLAGCDDAAERERRAAAMQRDLVDLDLLVGELLEYASLDEGIRRVSRESFDVDAEIDALLADAEGLAPSLRLARDGEGGRGAFDRRLFRRAVGNLLANAVRFARSEVRVRVGHEAGELVIQVEDDGPGVPLADRARILEPMVRLEGGGGRDNGVGLGLSLVDRIARAHGGRLMVGESAGLGGAGFVMRLAGGAH